MGSGKKPVLTLKEKNKSHHDDAADGDCDENDKDVLKDKDLQDCNDSQDGNE
jgi:hypothetical protein